MTLSTHDVGGLSDSDVQMAKFIETAAKSVWLDIPLCQSLAVNIDIIAWDVVVIVIVIKWCSVSLWKCYNST